MHKSTVLISLFILLSFSSCNMDGEVSPTSPPLINIDTSQKAFPSAEGYGQYSQGGRGGEVRYVTNLNDDGPGSFRDAVTGSGKRTIVFAVSGIIELQSLLVIDKPYLTIAGQAAPNNGITLKNAGIYIKTHDVQIRHLRIRPGDATQGHKFEDRDALTIGQNSYSIMIDHVSASWAVDEIFSTFYEPQFITVQWCLLSEGLSRSMHPEGEHSKGLLIGDNTQKASVHHNVFAHLNDRSPVQVKGGSSCDAVSNLVYNWGKYAFSFAINYVKNGVKVNLMNNWFKKGPSTTGDFLSEPDYWLISKIYIANNVGDDPLLLDFNAKQQTYISARSYLSPSPVEWAGNIQITDIAADWDAFLSRSGATLPKRDVIDQRIINEINATSGAIIDSPSEVGGYPEWPAISMSEVELSQYDSDKDGMPNTWETAHNLNPDLAADGNEDPDSDGYTNLEEFLNDE